MSAADRDDRGTAPTAAATRSSPERAGKGPAGDDHLEHEQVGKAFDRTLLRRLVPFAKPDARAFGASLAMLLAITLLEVALPWLLRLAVDGPVSQAKAGGSMLLAVDEGERHALLVHVAWLAAASLGVALLTLWMRAAQFLVINRAGQRVLHRIRAALFAHLQRLPIAFFDKQPTGRLVSRVTNDIETLNELFTSGVITLAGDVLKVVVLIGAVFWIHPVLAWIALVAVPVLAWVSAWFRIHARQAYRETRSTIARVTAFIGECIGGIRVLQAFSREDKATDRFASLNRAYFAANLRTGFYFAMFFPVVDGVTLLTQGSVFWRGGLDILGGTLSVGQFLQFWFYLGLMFEPLREMAEKYNVLQSAMASAERVFTILDTQPETADPPVARPLAAIRGEVKFDDVWFSYRPGEPVLKGVRFTAQPGETIALVGATGGGKTTITALLARFYEPDAGRILLDGVELRDHPRRELRRQIAYVAQDVFLFAGTALENLRLGGEAVTEVRAKAAADEIGALRFIERLPGGFDYALAERGSNLSAGERQILAFARALAVDPRVLILDEATANVDPETELRIEQAIERLLAGRTSIVVAHRLSTIRRASRILVIHHGEIREQGTHDELLQRDGLYRKLYRLQFGGSQEQAPARGALAP